MGFWRDFFKGFKRGLSEELRNRQADRELPSEGASAFWQMTAPRFEAHVVALLRSMGWQTWEGARTTEGALRLQALDPGAPLGYGMRHVTIVHAPDVDEEAIARAADGLDMITRAVVIASGFFSDEARAAAAALNVDLLDGDQVAALVKRQDNPQYFGT